jgi:hypothetical protein
MPDPTELIDDLITKTPDWRGETVARIREIIHDADPETVEEWKYMGSPVFSHGGMICVITVLKAKVKLTFHEGASLPDPDKLFNNGFGGKNWRAIDIDEGYKLNETALKALIRSGVEHNLAKAKPAKARES